MIHARVPLLSLLPVLVALSSCAGANSPANEDAGADSETDTSSIFDMPGRDASSTPDTGPAPDASTSADAALDSGAPDAVDPSVEARYRSQCASCHGTTGEGGTGPALTGWTRDRAILVDAIDARMPQADPAACVGTCAEELADYILGWGGDGSCDEVVPARASMRLLTPREYANTLRDLLGGAGASCAAWNECDQARESCEAGRCEPMACDTHRFVFDPRGANYTSVHVAGSFNDWPGTVSGGGYALSWDADAGRWHGAFAVGEGRHEYKFVLDERDWVADATNPDSAPDGFGSNNSVLTRSCAANAGGGTDWARHLPAAVRPEGFNFETHADSGNVTAAHIELYLRNAPAVADVAVAQAARLSGCTGGTACARDFVEAFGRRAFRRPLTDDELTRYSALVSGAASFDAGVARAVEQFVLSPHFLYRFELGDAQGDGTHRLTAWETATALSYTLWGTMPDDRLLDDAAAGRLDDPEGIEAAARRMLDDPRAREGIRVFAEQWLGIEAVDTMVRDGLDAATRAALREETRRLVEHVVFDGTGRFPELFSADYTFANDALGRLYGFDVDGDFEQVAYDERRAGVLGHGSVLGVTAHSDQTSPIRRGLWVRRNVLCQEFGAPPANAGGVPEVDPNASTRERFRQHTDDPFCASCHQYIDDLGFGFEAFDSIGVWRTTDGRFPVDANGNLNDVEGFGTDTDAPFSSLPELADIIVESEAARSCFVRQYTRFARGRLETPDDRCALQRLEERFLAADLDIRELMVAVVTDPAFLTRR